MLIAIPTETPGGLEASISEHFGHCQSFTLIEIDNGVVGEVTVLANTPHEQGGCMAPVQMLKSHDVDVLIAGGMGGRPLAGFQQVGIEVHFKEKAATVADAVELYLGGETRRFGEAETCGGGAGMCGGHHEPVQRAPIEGTPDVREGRVVTFDYELRDGEGELLDSSATTGPMRYLHGVGQILAPLERGLEGLEPGQQANIAVPRGEAFGERDDERIGEVPRDSLPPGVQVGSVVTGEDQSGHRFQLVVRELGETTATLDGNHPLAGRDLVFSVEVRAVESATPEELEHGHVH